MTPVPAEVSEIHTRLLRLGLAPDEAQAYWAHASEAVPAERAGVAFARRWFGAKSMARVRLLLTNMVVRFDAYPEALEVLSSWAGMDSNTRRLVCHIHLQLADPLYRRFTGSYLVGRLGVGSGTLGRPQVIAWVNDETGRRWSDVTVARYASALMTAAHDAGLLEGRKDPRRLAVPTVPDSVLGYALYLLRGIQFDGTLTSNLYFASFGLAGDDLDRRLGRLSSVVYRKLGDVIDFEWAAPDLRAWGRREAVSA